MFKNLSLKNKLAISASVAIIIGCILVEIISFRASINRMESDVNQRLRSATASYNQYVTDWLTSKENALTALSSDIKKDAIITHLKQVKNSAAFDNVFLAYPDGSQQNANGVVLPDNNNDPRKWGWYINASATPGKVYMDNPSVAAATGANVVSLGRTVELFGQTLVLGADVEITDIINNLNKVILPGDGDIFIVNDKGNIFTHKNTKLLNESVSKLGLNDADIRMAMRSDHKINITVKGEDYELYAQPIEKTRLTTVIMLSHDSLTGPLYSTLYKQLILTVVLVIICIALFTLLCNRLFAPLRNVGNALQQIASGSGDLTQRIELDSNDEVGRLAKGFNTFVASQHQLIAHIRTQAEQLTEQSNLSAQRANQTAAELSKQQQEINMVATAVTEMASATQEIASHAEQTAQSSQESATNTHNGYELVTETKSSIEDLNNELTEASQVISELAQHADNISTVLATIQGIAEQTNLLALNAAIEAARAGEQGRGFAVVADEVRVLSQRTHASTEEIKSTIDTLQDTTKRAVTLMENSAHLAVRSVEDADKASESLKEINDAVTLISDMATQIATAAEEQTHVTSEITQNVTAIRDVTEQLVEGSADTLNQSNNLKSQAHELSEKVATFKLN